MIENLLCVLCMASVVLFPIIAISRAVWKSNFKFRRFCGECSYNTGWTSESVAGDIMYAHYLHRHPGVPPRGLIQWR
ncbi:hypothetical protein [Glycomyces algeriensis]|uniref:hypothetical protein n=1 Tax=Glycomyces algeriensis TaxID=256037 RepID=UPI0022DA066B|nr:hypothetical protein [Glycomyces algeriensis]MDA1368329.1 hypothetical protein [Glycomyces algeriensis]MDR7351770.1 hypothetical protein [Glycomyces algeriensis]